MGFQFHSTSLVHLDATLLRESTMSEAIDRYVEASELEFPAHDRAAETRMLASTGLVEGE